MVLQLMLLEEKCEQSQWAVAALTTTSSFQIPLWRPSLAQWFLSSAEALERMDGNRGNFRRAEAYTAMKIFDIHLSSRSREIQENSDIGEKWYRSLAVGCFFVALRICTNKSDASSITVGGESMSVESFLRTCNALDDVTSIEDFTTMLESIHKTLEPFMRFRSEGTPLVSTDFFGELKDHLVASFPRLFQENTTYFPRAEALMDRTLGNLWFVSYAPSLNAVAALLVAMQDAEQEAIEGLLGFYTANGGNGLTCIHNLVGYLGMQAAELEAEQQIDLMQMQRLQVQHLQMYAQAEVARQNQPGDMNLQQVQGHPSQSLQSSMLHRHVAAPLQNLFQRTSHSSSISSGVGVPATMNALPTDYTSIGATTSESNMNSSGNATNQSSLQHEHVTSQLHRRSSQQDRSGTTSNSDSITSESNSNNGTDLNKAGFDQ